MTAIPDINALFARAEAAFANGDGVLCLEMIAEIEVHVAPVAALYHLKGLAQKQIGQLTSARNTFEAALNLAPRDVQLNNNLANILFELGEYSGALSLYDITLELNAEFAEARLNRAICLHKLGRFDAARDDFSRLIRSSPGISRLWSAKALMEYDAGNWDSAQQDFDRALEIKPDYAKALVGRARLALDLGEEDCVDRYEAALAQNPADGAIAIGLAHARSIARDKNAAATLEPFLDASPDWREGHEVYAGLLWEQGHGDNYASRFEQALRTAPDNDELRAGLCGVYAGVDAFQEAFDVAMARPSSMPPAFNFLTMAATLASAMDNDAEAENIFARIPEEYLGAANDRGKFYLKQMRLEKAENCLSAIREAEPGNIAAWAYSDIGWRLSGDARHRWLHGQNGLYGTHKLALEAAEITEIAEYLRQAHHMSAAPIGQSLRSGTQTRGRLLMRSDPPIRKLRSAIEQAVQAHWHALPPRDDSHPLLTHRAKQPLLDGSWSVRLTDSGFHISHIHPHGLLSSACYLAVPAEVDDSAGRPGWLELGRTPAELKLPLEPLASIRPEEGMIALFPSTLFHGTRPFAAGERISVAFDIVASQAAITGSRND